MTNWDKSALREVLRQRLNFDELRDAAADLGIDYEGLDKGELVRQLIFDLYRRERLSELVTWLKRNRPDIRTEDLLIKGTSQSKLVALGLLSSVVLMTIIVMGWLMFRRLSPPSSAETNITVPTSQPAANQQPTIKVVVIPLATLTNVPPSRVSTPRFYNLVFCADSDFDLQAGQCRISTSEFRGVVTKIYYTWEVENVYRGMPFFQKWYKDGVLNPDNSSSDTGPKICGQSSFDCIDFEFNWVNWCPKTNTNCGLPFPTGVYRVEFYLENPNNLVLSGAFTVRR